MSQDLQNQATVAAEPIGDAVAGVRDRIVGACHRSGRSPMDVRLIAISKTMPPERIREAFQAGIIDFGENRVQEAADKRTVLADLPIIWHLVGTLQRNKAALAARLFDSIHSVDSVAVARKIDSAVEESRARLPVLIQLNLAGEETKGGVSESEAVPMVEELSQLKRIQVKGLMQVPPFFANAELSRPYFRKMAAIRRQILAAKIEGVVMDVLSMGMSHDFEVAIEEGATHIRVGRAIFGERGH